MDSAAELLPAHEPAEGILATTMGMALDAIPLIGPMAGRLLDHALAERAADRQQEFNQAVVRELQALAQADDRYENLTVADVIASDEFAATLSKAQREAAETASTTKRERLARAATRALVPADFTASERANFLRLTSKYEDVHIWLLSYFTNPIAWLDLHGLTHVHTDVQVGEIGEHVAEALGVGFEGQRLTEDIPVAVTDAVEDLVTDSTLGLVNLDAIREHPFNPQITPRGTRFLTYLGISRPENEPVPPQ